MFKFFEELDHICVCFILLLVLILGLAIRGTYIMEQYIVDHECEVTETKTETHVHPMMVGKVMTVAPVTSTHRHYQCKVDGDKGRDFWY